MYIFLRHAHLARERRMRHPFRRSPWVCLLQHLVDLLEGKTLSLGNEEVCEGEGDAAEGSPEKEDLGAEVGISGVGADEVGGDDPDDLLGNGLVGCLLMYGISG